MSARQLAGLGLGSSAVSKRAARGRLHRVHRGVYAVGHAGLSQEGRWMAALLAAGDGAALSHLSAAALWEISRWRPRDIDVLAPRRRREHRGARVHGCRRLDSRDVTRARGIPVTTVARTLVDLTDVLDAHQLANLIHEAAYRRILDIQATRAAIARARGRHRLHLLNAALAAHASGSAGTRSTLEDRFLGLVRAAGLAEPLVNVRLPAAGRGIEVDFHWPDSRLCVEVDGGGHARPRTRREDEARDRLLRDAGHRVLRFTGDDVERRPAAVLTAVQVATAE